jgi:hypothetical protein
MEAAANKRLVATKEALSQAFLKQCNKVYYNRWDSRGLCQGSSFLFSKIKNKP